VPTALTTQFPLYPALEALGYSQSPAIRAWFCATVDGIFRDRVLTQTFTCGAIYVAPLRGWYWVRATEAVSL